MKVDTKKAKFFCDCCGSEVPQNAKVCQYCGKFFAAVRCPKCGNTGSPEQFTNGCPKCGYAVGGSHSWNGASKKQKNIKNRNSSQYDSNFFSGKKNKAYQDSGLPVWIYVVMLAVLVGVVAGLYSCIVS